MGTAIDRLVAVRDALGRDGNAAHDARHPDTADFRMVSIPSEEGEALRTWVEAENAVHTVEVGLAYAWSALYLCEGLLRNGHPDAKHVAMDPFQSSPTGYADGGLEILAEAGVRSLVEFHGKPSQLVLPRLLAEGRRFDLAFVDGNHRFDAVFLDLYYLGRLARPGGVIVLDDHQLPGIAKAASFFVKNLGWAIEELSPLVAEHQWVVLRTAKEPDTRDFRYFVDF